MALLSTIAVGLDGLPVSYDYFRPQMMFIGVDSGSINVSSSTSLLLLIPSGGRLVIGGEDMIYDPSQSFPWASGTVTSVQFWSRDYTVKLAEISGFNVKMDDFGHALDRFYSAPDGPLSIIFGGDDTLTGGESHDVLLGFGGNDSMSGGGGDDTFNPGTGSNTIKGGEGYDTVSYWNLSTNGPGSDPGITLNLQLRRFSKPNGETDSFESIEAAEGTYQSDKLTGDTGHNQLIGFSGNDLLSGLEGDDAFDPGDGIDTIIGGDGFDEVWYFGYAGPNGIEIDFNNNTVLDPWRDVNTPIPIDVISGIEGVRGTGNTDTMLGSSANESFIGHGGADIINGGGGDDIISYLSDIRRGGTFGVNIDLALEQAIDGFGTQDTVIDIEIVIGTNFNDRILGDDFANTLEGHGGQDTLGGGSGNDLLNGGAGADQMTGGAGDDTFYIDNTADQLIEISAGGTADLAYTTVSYILAAYVENLHAAGSASIILTGNALNNLITGNIAANRLNGGAGKDTLSGGGGKDVFVFTTALSSNHMDRIVDFNVKDDTIQLDNAVFKKLGKKMSSKFFTIGSKAKDKDDYIVYDNKKGVLFYDADGSGKGKAVEFTSISKNLKMTYTDFLVI